MSTTIVIALCLMLLLGYIFDLTSTKTKMPTVILLIVLGALTRYFGLEISGLEALLPALGTLGLILIVLEGSLELEIDRSKIQLIKNSAFLALLPMLILSFAFAYAFSMYSQVSLKQALINTIPLFIVSSAIAIPSVSALRPENKGFVIYETSMSDIFGVMLFDFIISNYNEQLTVQSFTTFGMQLVLIAIVSFIATLALAYLLGNINHHVKYVPIILAVLMIYFVSKHYHLPSLVFILGFGLFLSNFHLFRNFRFARRLNPDFLMDEVHKFRDLVSEFTFLIRALFFLVFGYLVNLKELINTDTMLLSSGIVIAIFAVRMLLLRLFSLPYKPLAMISPRGLITILLALSIPSYIALPYVNNSLITQVIVLTVLVMMFGLMWHRPVHDVVSDPLKDKIEDEVDLIMPRQSNVGT